MSSNFNLPILHWVSLKKDVNVYNKILPSATEKRFDDLQCYGLLYGSLMTLLLLGKTYSLFLLFYYAWRFPERDESIFV